MIASAFHIQDIINSPSKLAILRLFCTRPGFKGTGRAIASLAGYSAPSTHESLKALHARHILNLEVIGKQYIYTLNEEDRLVQKIICPLFQSEANVKEEIRDFLLKELKTAGLKSSVVSLILYGSVQKNEAGQKSDTDVAVIVGKAADVKAVADRCAGVIMPKFKAYFGLPLDPYIKSAAEFRELLKKNKPPVSTLMKSYSVLYGKEPLEI